MRLMALAVIGVAALTGCADLVGGDGDLSAEEARALSALVVGDTYADSDDGTLSGTDAALAADETDAAVLADGPHGGSSTFGGSGTLEFTLTRSCPLGGEVVFSGTRVREVDTATRSGSLTFTAERVHESCARPLGAGRIDDQIAVDEGLVITLQGDPGITVEGYREWSGGTPHGIQTLSMQGAVTWALDDGRSGSCAIDVSAAVDPETWTRTVTGTVCGHEVDHTAQFGGGGGGGQGGHGGHGPMHP